MKERKQRQPEQSRTPQRRGANRQDASAARPAWSTIAWGAALVILVGVVYWPALDAGYVMDDDINLQANPTLYSLDGLRQMWFEPDSVQQYYPLMHTMFWVESRLWGFDPRGYHAVNILLHGLNVLLVWWLVARLRVPGAWLAAALFAVHPVEVESVAWAVERKNVLSLAFALGSMLAYLSFDPPQLNTESKAPAVWRNYALSLVLFAAALFSKTAVVTLPAVLLVIYWWQRGRVTARDCLRLLPFFALAVALGLVTMWQEKYHVGATGEEAPLSWLERLLVAGRALWFYAAKMAWPYPTMFFYPRFVVDVRSWWQYLFPLAALATPVALWLARGRVGRGPLAAVLIFAGVLVPVLGFFVVYYHRFSFVADHFQYHASIALVALAAASATLLFRHFAPAESRTRIVTENQVSLFARAVAVALLLPLAVLSHRAAGMFHDEETLYRDTVAKNPGSWIARSNLGVCLNELGRFDEALETLGEALRIDPTKPRVDFNYGKVIVDRGERHGFRPGDLDEALAHFRQAAHLNPNWAQPYAAIGATLVRAHKFDEARQNLDHALLIEPECVDALCMKGFLLLEINQLAEAQDVLQQAQRLAPNRPDIYFTLGQASLGTGQLQRAAGYYENAIKLKPDYLAAWNNLGGTRFKLGDMDGAIECFREIIRHDPNSAQAQNMLATALEKKKQMESSRQKQ